MTKLSSLGNCRFSCGRSGVSPCGSQWQKEGAALGRPQICQRERRVVHSPARTKSSPVSSLQASVPASESEGDPRRSSNSSSSVVEAFEATNTVGRLEFKVSGFFLFGSPLGLVLALRKTVMPAMDGNDPPPPIVVFAFPSTCCKVSLAFLFSVAQMHPACEQVYNLFHAADPCASRLEPLLAPQFHAVPPFAIPRYQKYPLGDGSSTSLGKAEHEDQPQQVAVLV